ncbi:MAG: hypothetical protein ABWW65_01260 [Thermoprotei archaeon]
MKILVVGFASPVHSEEYYTGLYRELIERIKGLESVDIVEDPVTSATEIPPNYDLYVYIYLTGGTSKLSYQSSTKITGPIVLIASGEHNALASALSARNRFRRSGYKTLVLPYNGVEDFTIKLKQLYRVVKAIDKIRSLRILEINKTGEPSPESREYTGFFGGEVHAISYKELLEKLEEASIWELKNSVWEVESNIKRGDISNNDYERIIRIYHGLKKIIEDKGYNAVLFDCFAFIMETGVTPCLAISMLLSRGIPAVCEADYYSLPLLVIAQELFELPGWIANIAGYTGKDQVRFAHCTIAHTLGSGCKLVDHFETGRPAAVTCKLRYKDMLIMRFSLGFKELHVYRGEVSSSGYLEKPYCRTQALVKIHGYSPIEFIRKAAGNHHVLVPYRNGAETMLELLCWILGVKLVK